MNDRRRLETYRFWHSRYFLESVPCRISSARSTLIAPDNFHPAATKTICRASWGRFQSSAKTSPSSSTSRENAHLRMQREFMSLSRGGANGFAGAKVVKIRDIPFPDRCNVPASAKRLDIAAATRKLPYQLRVYEWQIVINSPRPDVELRARARAFRIKILEHYFFRCFLFLFVSAFFYISQASESILGISGIARKHKIPRLIPRKIMRTI